MKFTTPAPAQPDLKSLYNARMKNVVFPAWAAPVAIFSVCFFCFGVLLSRLGYFQDDWHHVYYAYWGGAEGLKRFLFTDSRPLAFLVYIPFFNLLGFEPSHWHWSLMVIRFLTALLFWLALSRIWPELTHLTAWLALFFAVYPVFPLQSLSVAYTLHWFLYLVFMLSVYLMLLAAYDRKAYLGFSLPAILLQMFHLALIEYFAGVELIRPILLWFAFRDRPLSERLKLVAKHWLPYLGVLGLYTGYRLSYSTLYGYDRFQPALLDELIHSPLSGIPHFLQNFIQDFIYILISPWYGAIDPGGFDLSRVSMFAILGSVIIFAALGYFFVQRLASQPVETSSLSATAKQIVIAGAIALVLGVLPSWLVGFSIYSKNPLWSGRLALPAMLGASLIVVGLVYLLVEKPMYRHLVLSILLGIAVGSQVRNARDFQESWDKQLQFYWQLYWRAPALEPDTLLVADNEVLFYMGYYPTAYAINVLYDQSNPAQAAYWFNAGSEHINPETFAQGEPAVFSKYSTVFSATKKDVVSITFEPAQQECLWVLRPSYKEIRFLSNEAYTWMKVSDLSRIKQTATYAPPAAIFGQEPEHSWCFYYEKADLASQIPDWPTVTRLWEQAQQKDLRPGNSVELLPFIEAYARLGNWEQAKELTRRSNSLTPPMPSALCTLWEKIESTTAASAGRDQIILTVKKRLGCQD